MSVCLIRGKGHLPVSISPSSRRTTRTSGTCMAVLAFEIQSGTGCMVHTDVFEHTVWPPRKVLTFLVCIAQTLTLSCRYNLKNEWIVVNTHVCFIWGQIIVSGGNGRTVKWIRNVSTPIPACLTKAELLKLKPHPLICMRNFINEKSWKLKKLTQLLSY